MFTFSPITHPTNDTKHPLLLLTTENGNKYFFGKIPEGSQRSITENKIRISKLENIFLTGELKWNSFGGLPGMILTLADQGRDKLKLHYNSPIINFIISTWRYYVFRFGIDLTTNVIQDQELYQDKSIIVKSITVTKENETEGKNSDNIFTKELKSVINSIASSMFPKKSPISKFDPSTDPHLNVSLPNLSYTYNSTQSYEISFHPIRGKFKVKEAINLGIPKGPLFSKLANGESITLEDGTVILPEQVLEKERNVSKVLILDIPNDNYIPHFKEKFKNYDFEDLSVIYYFLDEDITIGKELIEFMEIFPDSIQHIVSHSLISPNTVTFKGSAITLLKLKSLQVDNYNLPRTDRIYSKEFFDCFNKNLPSDVSVIQQQEEPLTSTIDGKNVHVYRQNTILKLDPFTKDSNDLRYKITNKNSDIVDWKKYYDQFLKPFSDEIGSVDDVVNSQINTNNYNNTIEKSRRVEIVTLGTGSALPSKYRNVVSTLIKVPYINKDNSIENRCVLLDAGENTLGTILRMFSSIDCKKLFKDLKMIYLSHLHADHHLGIISILEEWYKYNQEDKDAIIYLVTPWQYNKFIHEWLNLEKPEILERIRYISGEHLVSGNFVRREIQPITIEEFDSMLKLPAKKKQKLSFVEDSSYRDLKAINTMYQDLKIKSFQTCRAKHCNWAYSNTITFYTNSNPSNNTFKVSYSGDTRPNIKSFAQDIGYKSDLLIHEATLDNELIEDAILKRHCTIDEAIEVSNSMEANKLILTHFSQRYPKLPQIDNNKLILAKEYCFAFDGMIVDYDRIGEQQKYFPILKKIFISEEEEEKHEEKQEDVVDK
ncbi:hypothetical protein Kpol_489p13 [Vanderwaltozyma polyspora DSM 70294]|uniref:ribonuclease Z n=1 Tax=Vanderwaltozyma polyspora (strain ATCC 22028 / DSM 70294 / BCRC 21397 / CBS 2163 / NBRC 10782 / NRRL Y-8283 / UCD 57-17) TaxID=436907 RepID=A7TQ27_VANPO|nr:uncharacterized protein Kpol_489p13 [Vanderwaltozyma polyspora DSM 70294]EDO15632.1 hypothetical protein Kpol_489p13 [Vanderwaltozyma polyspora DSM 70294]